MKSTLNDQKECKAIRPFILVFASISVLTAIVSSLALYCYKDFSISLNIDNVVSFMGLFFTIVGVVATVYFVVLSYRARLIRDELIEKKDNAEAAINEAQKQWEVLVTAAMDVLYQNYSFLIRENPSRVSEYKLQASRLACELTLLDPKDRLESIELLGTIDRIKNSPEWNEIDEDIKLLERVLYAKDESERIKRKANEAITLLKEKKNEN